MTCRTCPFAHTDESEEVQAYGCLPSPYEIMQMQSKGCNWECHSQENKLCSGLVHHISYMNSYAKDLNKNVIIFDKNAPLVKYKDWYSYGEEKAVNMAKSNY